ncbi:Ribose ABC transport system, permease protein RbsC [Candidatus Rhodobacter oscarellae]|uniref:Ribose ABC transport system, permease protein RbsC n=1 Tax=Candidatus Rhodobacter oscarellae TaxID=1675527 RepID=A0A0J9E4E8_9RHOB|nr:ABC transporter permease [Candidatus Rhodobacter lobularis]KMW57640.1 Ribose ABC transport system, permease protein RbsC [Candidatus Rhodobacter lobularis]
MTTLNGSERKTNLSDFFSLSGATGPLIGLLVLCAFLSFATDSFFSFRNFLNIADQITVLGIMAVGMTFVILIGGIDLSVGSILALSMMVLGYLNVEAGYPMGVAIIGALLASAVAGAVSGLLITEFRVPAFIATLAMMSIARGLANMITNGSQIIGFPTWFNLGAIIRHFGFLTITVAVMITVFVVATLFLRFRQEGRALYAIGGNPEVARLAGINVRLTTIMVYMVCALLSGLAGILLAARLDSVQPSSGVAYELDAIAAVVIGGTSLSGGTGGIVGTIIGVLIIGVLRNGLNLLSVSPFLQAVIIGLVIVLAVAAETFKHRNAR